MSNAWERFEGVVNAEEVIEAKAKFENPKAGIYKCKLESISPSENKDGLPMLKAMFRTEVNKVMYYNQNLQNINYPNMTAVNVADAVKLVSALKGEDIEFTGLGALAEEVGKLEIGKQCVVKVYYGKKDLDEKFPKFEIVKEDATEVAETVVDAPVKKDTAELNDDGLPF